VFEMTVAAGGGVKNSEPHVLQMTKCVIGVFLLTTGNPDRLAAQASQGCQVNISIPGHELLPPLFDDIAK
jgi:hypothetical protein